MGLRRRGSVAAEEKLRKDSLGIAADALEKVADAANEIDKEKMAAAFARYMRTVLSTVHQLVGLDIVVTWLYEVHRVEASEYLDSPSKIKEIQTIARLAARTLKDLAGSSPGSTAWM